MKSNPIITKEQPKQIKVVCSNNCTYNFIGWHRYDLDEKHPNWHYYETVPTDGKSFIYHFRKTNIILVMEQLNSDDQM